MIRFSLVIICDTVASASLKTSRDEQRVSKSLTIDITLGLASSLTF